MQAKLKTLRRSLKQKWNLHFLPSEPIARAIRELDGPLPAEERRWVERIEALRAEQNASTEQVDGEALGEVSKLVSKAPRWCLLLFRLVQFLRPTTCIEMGAAVGISGAYQATALKSNGHGSLVTLEGSAARAAVAKRNFEKLGLPVEVVVGKFQDTLATVLAAHKPVDYVFVDGHHDELATLTYFDQIIPHLAENAVVVFDDITWSAGMKRAWEAITVDPRVRVAVDFGPLGLCVMGDATTKPGYYGIPL